MSTLANYSTSGDDFFGEMYETRPSKIWILVFSLILTPVNVLLLYSVIWYERFGLDLKRTLVNQAVSSMCCWGLVIELLQDITLLRLGLTFCSDYSALKLLIRSIAVMKSWFNTLGLSVEKSHSYGTGFQLLSTSSRSNILSPYS